MPQRKNLTIPYGIADFKRIRNEGWYYVDQTIFLAKAEMKAKSEMELSRSYCDFCLSPECVYNRDVCPAPPVRYTANDEPTATYPPSWYTSHLTNWDPKAEEGIAQLQCYVTNPTVPALSVGTRLHLILY